MHKNKYPCKVSSFGNPKTIRRNNLNDMISKRCFNELGWNIVNVE